MLETQQSVQEHGPAAAEVVVVAPRAERKHTLLKLGMLGALAYGAYQLAPSIGDFIKAHIPSLNVGSFDSHVEFGEVTVMVNDVTGTTDLVLAEANETITNEIDFKNSIPLFPDANQKYTTKASANVELCVSNNNGELNGLSITPVSEDGKTVDTVRVDLDLDAVHTCTVTFNPTFCTENEEGTERTCEPTKIGEYSASELQQWADAAKGNQETRDYFRGIASNVVLGAAQFSGECIANKIGDETAQQIFFHDILKEMFTPLFVKFNIPPQSMIITVRGEMQFIPAENVHYDMYNSDNFQVENPVLQCKLPEGT